MGYGGKLLKKNQPIYIIRMSLMEGRKYVKLEKRFCLCLNRRNARDSIIIKIRFDRVRPPEALGYRHDGRNQEEQNR